MTLATDEFIRRFLIHVLPKGLHRIRHYGLFAKAACADNIARARQLLGSQKSQSDTTDNNDGNQTPILSHPCPCCGGRMIIIEIFNRGSTPHYQPAGPIIAIRIDTS
jgi:putative transposase